MAVWHVGLTVAAALWQGRVDGKRDSVGGVGVASTCGTDQCIASISCYCGVFLGEPQHNFFLKSDTSDTIL